MRVVVWGTYDLGKPRVRILLRGLREARVDVLECHRNVWTGVEDKSQIRGLGCKLLLVLRWILSYPRLIYRYLRLPSHDAVLVCYMGQLDVLVLWPFAKLRRKPIVWDAFLSLYNTVVEDRRLVGKWNPLAMGFFALEWLACRAADRLVLDTNAHGDYFSRTYRIAREKIDRVFVGAETDIFRMLPASDVHTSDDGRMFTVLFYGQFIPLHGIKHIVRAAKISDALPIRWLLIGKGQQAQEIRTLIERIKPDKLTWIDWVPYEQLIERIEVADVCLGIFGDTDKAKRVIPNKVFQVLAVGKPLITMQSPAASELLKDRPGILLVPPGDPQSIVDAVAHMMRERKAFPRSLHRDLLPLISPAAVGADMRDLISAMLAKTT